MFSHGAVFSGIKISIAYSIAPLPLFPTTKGRMKKNKGPDEHNALKPKEKRILLEFYFSLIVLGRFVSRLAAGLEGDIKIDQ